ncbi:MAG: phosphatidylserine/phosphatidylglycerophosphate/cardiolipin synthase family protein [Planctomycetes bacterium]|nr:phosphatidylserine/phosphatidylglycerophosphate/cardiolipin synthase family protein [Planctomycetota bacterium]
MDLALQEPIETALSPAASPARRRYWRSEKIWFDGDAFFAAMLRDIERARTTIDLQTYIFQDDLLGQRVTDALRAAAARGVVVRMLVDGAGAGAWCAKRARELIGDRLSIRIYHPLPWLLFSRIHNGRSGALRLFRMLMQINRRTHRKLCLIDQRAAWVGSFNCSSLHCREYSCDEHWRDTGARVEGGAIGELYQSFNWVWRRSWRLSAQQMRPPVIWPGVLKREDSGLVRLNDTLRQRRKVFRDLVERIAGAKRRVWVTAAYFVPNHKLVAALGQAARNGIDVRMLMPTKCDVVFMPWVSAAFYLALLKQGVRIYEYQPRVLHAKTVQIDDWLTVGSTNLNYRSLLHDLEADIVMLHPRTHKAFERAYLDDLAQSKEITIDDWKRRPWLQKWLGRIALRIRYWL